MCFLLYAGTGKAIARSRWQREAPGIYVQSLIEYDVAIQAHFSRPEVQQIGSTSGCGCDFPHVMYQNGGWPSSPDAETDEEQLASDRFNRASLVALLQTTGEAIVELYGVWAGDFTEEPRVRQEISLASIRREDFHFNERCFYRVFLNG
ncbi:MAG: hypothetical protein ABSD67_07095 [Terracidiphilus sp.]|jgi:hypothetical protein